MLCDLLIAFINSGMKKTWMTFERQSLIMRMKVVVNVIQVNAVYQEISNIPKISCLKGAKSLQLAVQKALFI